MFYFVHLQYGENFERSCLEYLNKIGMAVGEEYSIIIVDNLNRDKKILEGGAVKIPGSNEFLEFSGWEVGLRYLREHEHYHGPVIFSNDTFARHRVFDGSMLNAFSGGVRKYLRCEEAVFFGGIYLIDASPPYLTKNEDRRFITTYLFFLNGPAFNNLDTFLLPESMTRIVAPSRDVAHVNSVLHKDAAVTPYLTMIEEWLYRPSKKLVRWHGFEKLTDSNFKKFSLKFQSILMEHHLSQKLSGKGVLLVDWIESIDRSTVERARYLFARVIYAVSWRVRKLLAIRNSGV